MNDPKQNQNDKIEITGRISTNDYFTFQGVVNGQKAALDLPKVDCEKMSSKELDSFIKRGLKATSDYMKNVRQ